MHYEGSVVVVVRVGGVSEMGRGGKKDMVGGGLHVIIVSVHVLYIGHTPV